MNDSLAQVINDHDNRKGKHPLILKTNLGSIPGEEIVTSFSTFTPGTFSVLNEEIKSTEAAIAAIGIVSPDDQDKSTELDKLQAHLAYYYGQKLNHDIALLKEAQQTKINDEDMDKVSENLYKLRSKIDKLIDTVGKSKRTLGTGTNKGEGEGEH